MEQDFYLRDKNEDMKRCPAPLFPRKPRANRPPVKRASRAKKTVTELPQPEPVPDLKH
jgi:hypothetical protein